MGIADKVSHLLLAPYDRTMFIDTDTYVCGDLSGCFELLDDFDLLVAHDALRVSRDCPEIDRVFPMFNSGLIFFRRSEPALSCLADWKRLYDIDCLEHGGHQMADQYTFRMALRKSTARIYLLPPEYHCMTWEASYLHDPVKVVHGRNDLPYPTIAAQANAVSGPRIFKPGLGSHQVHYQSRSASLERQGHPVADDGDIFAGAAMASAFRDGAAEGTELGPNRGDFVARRLKTVLQRQHETRHQQKSVISLSGRMLIEDQPPFCRLDQRRQGIVHQHPAQPGLQIFREPCAETLIRLIASNAQLREDAQLEVREARHRWAGADPAHRCSR